MNTTASAAAALPASLPASRPHLDNKPGPITAIVFIGLLAVGMLFTSYSLVNDVSETGAKTTTWVPYILLGVALLIALGFEFVNGFHDTANAVATVIYTHSLPPNFAVVWSGFFNFLGVLASSGAVAFGIISLLPVELTSSTRLYAVNSRPRASRPTKTIAVMGLGLWSRWGRDAGRLAGRAALAVTVEFMAGSLQFL